MEHDDETYPYITQTHLQNRLLRAQAFAAVCKGLMFLGLGGAGAVFGLLMLAGGGA